LPQADNDSRGFFWAVFQTDVGRSFDDTITKYIILIVGMNLLLLIDYCLNTVRRVVYIFYTVCWNVKHLLQTINPILLDISCQNFELILEFQGHYSGAKELINDKKTPHPIFDLSDILQKSKCYNMFCFEIKLFDITILGIVIIKHIFCIESTDNKYFFHTMILVIPFSILFYQRNILT